MFLEKYSKREKFTLNVSVSPDSSLISPPPLTTSPFTNFSDRKPKSVLNSNSLFCSPSGQLYTHNVRGQVSYQLHNPGHLPSANGGSTRFLIFHSRTSCLFFSILPGYFLFFPIMLSRVFLVASAEYVPYSLLLILSKV
uniref:Uncharacterized protein n=1 Tax=Cacopsylla melanoneura TaxID=428564 RepID=A0A8D8W794_9HEMI